MPAASQMTYIIYGTGLFRHVPDTRRTVFYTPCTWYHTFDHEQQSFALHAFLGEECVNPIVKARHGPPGGHDRRSGQWSYKHVKIFDVLDVVGCIVDYVMEAVFDYMQGMAAGAYGLMLTVAVLHFCAVSSLLLYGVKAGKLVAQTLPSRVCLMYFCLSVAAAAPTAKPQPMRARVPAPTDLELWRDGQSTLREQLARAEGEWALNTALARSAGEAPPPDLHRPLQDGAAELPLIVIPGNLIQVTLWTITPFYVPEVTDVEIPFPVTLNNLRRALRESFEIIPDFAGELVPKTPQIGEGFASFVAIPGWLRTTGRTVLVIDSRDVGGTVFAVHHEGVVSREAALQHADVAQPAESDVFAFGHTNAIVAGFPVEPIPGGVIKILERGKVCEWSDDIDFRYNDEDRWDSECDLPPDIYGTFATFQSTEEQLVCEIEEDTQQAHLDVAREVFNIVHAVRLPDETPAHLALAGRTISQTVAVIDHTWPDHEEAVFIFVDLRGICCFPQWIRVPNGLFDPVTY